MELTCKQCGARFRATIPEPLTRAVRLACPSCGNQMVLKPAAVAVQAPVSPSIDSQRPPASAANLPRRRIAVIADEARPFRSFLAEHLRRLGFDVTMFEAGETAFDCIRHARADLAIVNVYLKGRLGVEVTEDIRADATLGHTRVILIGALFRANRFRANPTNLYGADEYIEEQIPEKEFRQIIRKLFPEVGHTEELPIESKEIDEARRLARLILSDIVIYHPVKVEAGIRDDKFFEVLKNEIDEGRAYYDSRVPLRIRQSSEIFLETIQQFVRMKREEAERVMTGTER
jgi:CheY-like chemotaxis protein/DNA-directed RNA polymerase subunit RPC12/RpoP